MGPKLAITSHVFGESGGALGIACDADGCHAIDVRIDARDLLGVTDLATDLRARAARDVELRYHYPIRGQEEICSADASIADAALADLLGVIDRVAALSATYLTVHLPMASDANAVQVAGARSRLAEAVAHARSLGITLCLENLRWGLTSDPDVLLQLADATGAALTIDIGHAASSEFVERGVTAADVVRIAGERVRNAHVYEREDPHHIAPHSLRSIRAALEALCDTPCDWWVIELFDAAEVRHTRRLLREFLGLENSEPLGSAMAS